MEAPLLLEVFDAIFTGVDATALLDAPAPSTVPGAARSERASRAQHGVMEEARLELENAQRATTALRHARPTSHVPLTRYAAMTLHAVSAGLQAMSGFCYLQWHILSIVEEASMELEKENLAATALRRVHYPHEPRRMGRVLMHVCTAPRPSIQQVEQSHFGVHLVLVHPCRGV